jgi:prepilin-type N-terminal cleavage/methylation domain-containing protein
MAKREKIISNQSGFTLLEVMIAIAIFTVFATVFVTGQGYNLIDSGKLRNELVLKDICENKINDIISNPPELRDSLTLTNETKDVENNPNYQYTIEYKKFKVPDMNKLKNSAEDDAQNNPQDAMEKRVYEIFKENMEKLIWQVEVTAKDKTTLDTFKLSTWLYNQNAEVKIGTF